MNRVGPGDFSRADDGRDVEVAVGASRRADADVLVGIFHVQRVLVRLGIDGDRLDAELAARHDHAQRALPTIGDQNFLEHRYEGLIANRRSPYWTACPFST